MIYRSQSFTHHGHGFRIEADGWPSDELADAAVIDLQTWTIELSPFEAAVLHAALTQETEALIHELPYDRDQEPLRAVRQAQRSAMRLGLLHSEPSGSGPRTITLEAF